MVVVRRGPIPSLTTVPDVVLALVLTVAATTETVADGGDRLVLKTLMAALIPLALCLRRTRPSTSALIVAVGLTFGSLVTESPDQIAVLLAVVVSAYSVAAYAPTRDAVTGLALLGMAISISIAVDPSDELSNIPPTLALFLALPAGLGFAFHRRTRQLEELVDRVDSAERAAAVAVEAERLRIARELHDVVSHAVTLIAVQAEAGAAVLDTDVDSARRSLIAIGDASRDALAELHTLLGLLGEPERTEVGADLAHLPALVDSVRSAGVRMTVERAPLPGLPPEVDHLAYRVVQEGLTNALRHSRSPEVGLQVAFDEEQLRVRLESSGTPHRSAYGGSGSGLAGLRERVEDLGGRLTTHAEGDVFVLEARLPVAVE